MMDPNDERSSLVRESQVQTWRDDLLVTVFVLRTSSVVLHLARYSYEL